MNSKDQVTATSTEESLFLERFTSGGRDQYGGPIQPLSISGWILTAFLISILAATIILLCIAHYSRKESVEGALQPAMGALRIVATRPGLVVAVRVREGDMVSKGAALMTISMDSTLATGKRLGEALQATTERQSIATAQQAAARRDEIEEQRNELAAKRDEVLSRQSRLRIDAGLQEQRVSLVNQSNEAAKTLVSQQLMSALQYRQREEALIVARQGLSAIQRELEAIPSLLLQMRAQDRRLAAEAREIAASELSSKALLAEKATSVRAEGEAVLTAPARGEVAALQAKVGMPVLAGQTVATVVPNQAELQAELWVPSRAIGFLKRGDPVRLMYDAFPYQRFGAAHGHVLSVARAPTLPEDLSASMRAQESLYRVIVKLDRQTVNAYGKSASLSSGMRLKADIILEEQSLMAWIFDQLHASGSGKSASK